MNEIKYVRNTSGIARCLGFKLRGPRLRKQCKEISGWIKRPEFPQKTRHGWAAEEIIEWGKRFAREIAQEKEQRAAVAEVLSKDAPKSSAVKIVTALAGLGAGSMPRQAMGLEAIGAIIGQHFHVDCRRQSVHAWRKGQKLPAGAPPFPPPDSAGRFTVADCLAWYERWKLPGQNGNGQTPDLFASLPDERLKAELEELQHDRWVRDRDRGGWMEKSEHNRILAGLGKLVWPQFCELVERRLPAALETILKDCFGSRISDLGSGPEDLAAMRSTIVAEAQRRFQLEIDGLQRRFLEQVEQAKANAGIQTERQNERL